MEQNRQEIIRQCTRFVVNHYPVSPQQMLADLAAFTPPDAAADHYGSGELMANFEAEVAQLLFIPRATWNCTSSTLTANCTSSAACWWAIPMS